MIRSGNCTRNWFNDCIVKVGFFTHLSTNTFKLIAFWFLVNTFPLASWRCLLLIRGRGSIIWSKLLFYQEQHFVFLLAIRSQTRFLVGQCNRFYDYKNIRSIRVITVLHSKKNIKHCSNASAQNSFPKKTGFFSFWPNTFWKKVARKMSKNGHGKKWSNNGISLFFFYVFFSILDMHE